MTVLPLVSAIIPAHNGERYVEQAIRSVLQQDYHPVELIVVDDGSTDRTAQAASSHSQVRLIQQDNRGVANARNAGVNASSGKIISFLDQDDLWTPHKLSLQVGALLEDESLGFALGYERLLLESGTPEPAWLQRSGLDYEHLGYFPGTLVVHREVFNRVGGFCAEAVPAEGADWFLRASEIGIQKTIVQHVVLLKRVHDLNQSGDMTKVRRQVLSAVRRSITRRREAAIDSKLLVSVVMPVFNGEAHLAEAIESVLAQSYRPVQLIVVDDGSTDASASIATRYASSDVCLIQQPNRGTGAARNAGIERARGELLAHLDADDLWLPGNLERLVEALDHDPGAQMACGLVSEFVSPELTGDARRSLRKPRGPIVGHLVQAMLIRRSAHDRVGPFETTWGAGQDLAWLLRAQELGLGIAEVPELLVRRRLHAANKGRQHPELARQRCRILKQALDRRRLADEGNDSS